MVVLCGAIIPRAKRNAAGEDISRVVVSLRHRRPESDTSSKAVVLRHGRHGVWGEGQIASFKKLSGQEKLALKAAELRNTAVSPPFRLSELMRMAQAGMQESLDLISDLHDPEFFYEDISNLIASRPRLKPELLAAPFIAKTISTRVHNAYLLASSWKIVLGVLENLGESGMTDTNVRNYIKNQVPVRDAYLLVVDTIEMLSNLAQQELSVAVIGSNELGGLFSGTKTNKGFFATDAGSVMSAHRSLIDAIIIELVLPESRYEPYILTAVLRDALDTTPGEEAKKFSQAVFDALGKFVALVEMKDMLLGQLYGPEGDEWLKMPRKEAAGEIDEFFDAISQSLKASALYNRWQSWAYPLRKTKSQTQLEDLWKQINTVYIAETGHSIDTLWRLENERKPNPQYSTWYIPEFAEYAEDISSDTETMPFSLPGAHQRRKKRERTALVRGKKQFRNADRPRLRKAIRQEEENDSEYDGMPGLMSVSGSSDEEGSSEAESVTDEDEESDGGVESEWEGDEGRTMQALLNEAIREYQRSGDKVPPWTEESERPGGDTSFTGSLKSNPFMRMLRSFTGRKFNPDPTFRPPKMGEKPVYGPPRPPVPTPPIPEAKAPVASSTTSGPAQESPVLKAPRMTVEEVNDEEDGNAEDKKKKKKKKKKKPKKMSTAEESAEIKDALDTASPVQGSVTPAASPTPAPSTPGSTRPPSSATPPTTKSLGEMKSTYPHGYGASTSSLPIDVAPSVAQSARSYLAGKEGDAKVKVKTRADPSAINTDKEGAQKRGFFSKFTGEKKDKKKKVEESNDKKGEVDGKFGKRGVFQLPKRASALVGRLLGSKEDEAKGKAPMRWEHFVKAMKLLGFEEDKGSKGSRVTFYPPDSKDAPMVIHKPHPDPTISPVLLRTIGKRLRVNYGWAPEHFESRLGAYATYFDDDLD